jgi:hypothetical protein
LGERTGGAGRAGFLDDEVGLRAGGGECCAFGDAGAADLAQHDIGGVGEALGLFVEAGGGEEASGDGEIFGQRVDGGLVGLEVKGEDAGDGLGAQVVGGQRFEDEGDQFAGLDIALAADAEGEGARVVDEMVGGAVGRMGGYGDGEGSRHALREGVEPGGGAVDADGLAGEQAGGEGFGVFGVGEGVAGRGIVEG